MRKLPKIIVVKEHNRKKKNGSTTRVKKHTRSIPDGIKSNNNSYNG